MHSDVTARCGTGRAAAIGCSILNAGLNTLINIIDTDGTGKSESTLSSGSAYSNGIAHQQVVITTAATGCINGEIAVYLKIGIAYASFGGMFIRTHQIERNSQTASIGCALPAGDRYGAGDVDHIHIVAGVNAQGINIDGTFITAVPVAHFRKNCVVQPVDGYRTNTGKTTCTNTDAYSHVIEQGVITGIDVDRPSTRRLVDIGIFYTSTGCTFDIRMGVGNTQIFLADLYCASHGNNALTFTVIAVA